MLIPILTGSVLILHFTSKKLTKLADEPNGRTYNFISG
ncbi:hypothetical protein SAMN05444413_11957 [Roseivivax marinus]|nr:hypothetical protein SAMN05444413_11957 [Roseivivax marinus]